MGWFSSSTTVKVDPDLLLEKASEIDEFASSAGDIYDQMLNLFLALKEGGMWEGVAFDELVNVTTMNVEKFAPVAEKLEELADYLRRVATKMSNVDEEVVADIKTVSN